MNSKFKKIVAIATAAGTLISFSGCSNGNTQTATDTNKITYWVSLDSTTSQIAGNFGDTELAKKLMEKFGCTIEYQHPAQGQASEKFNVMIASGKLPDIIEYNWVSAYPGGGEKAIETCIVQELDLEKDAPNLYKYVQEHTDVDKMIKTDDGRYFGYPFIRGDKYLLTSAGAMVRQDWLDDLGMSVPETMDEWTAMLTAFKEKKGAQYPLTLSGMHGISACGLFVGAFGTFDELYANDEGKVAYGPMDDSYKDFLAYMNDWFSKGLIDPDYLTADSTSVSSNMLNGISGATFGGSGGTLGALMSAAPDDKFNLVGTKYPVLKKGDKPQFGNYDLPVTGTFAVISRDCKNKDLCAKILDYGYSDEGAMLYNFGIEGESYNMIDGYPTYADSIVKNSDGLSMSVAMSKYVRANSNGPFIQDKRYMEQYASLPQQKQAIQTWMDTDEYKHKLPSLSLSSQEQTELSSTIENIRTYKTEMESKFIMGAEPISNFDKFRQELIARGVEKYNEYYQRSYDRYNNR